MTHFTTVNPISSILTVTHSTAVDPISVIITMIHIITIDPISIVLTMNQCCTFLMFQICTAQLYVDSIGGTFTPVFICL